MNRLMSALGGAAVAAALVLGFAPTVTAPAEPGIATVSGTIRWESPTSWMVLDDAGHTPTGIASVELLRDRVRVHYDFRASKVSSLQVTPDDAFAAASVRVGASVGFTYTDVFFYMGSSQTPVSPALLTKRGGNVWITGSFHVDP